jgi:hypothetical protein
MGRTVKTNTSNRIRFSVLFKETMFDNVQKNKKITGGLDFLAILTPQLGIKCV